MFYVVPGRGETVAYLQRWFDPDCVLVGIDFDAAFSRLPFAVQLEVVGELLDSAERARSPVVARSFGAWLVLYALLERPVVFGGEVILLAPVLGRGGGSGLQFVAPRERRFWDKVASGAGMPAARMLLIAARGDPNCDIQLARRLRAQWPMELHELESDSHDLETLTPGGLRSLCGA